MKLMKITPCDTLFLGNSKELIKGKNNWVQSQNIPQPTTFYGAIASKFLSENSGIRTKVITKKGDGKKYIQIGRIFLCDESDFLYIIAPYTCTSNLKKLRDGKYVINTEGKIKFYPYYDDNYDHNENIFMNYNEYVKYKENITKVPIFSGMSIFKNSYKVGIELEKNKKAKEKYLYRLDQVEMNTIDKSWSFVVEYEIEGIQLKNKEGYLKLGGENKICKYRILETDSKVSKTLKEIFMRDEKFETNYIELITLSPSIVNEKYNDDEIKVMKVISGKAVELSGYSYEKGIRKKKLALNTGSVLILKIDEKLKNKSKCELKELINNKKLFIKSSNQSNENFRDGFSEFELFGIRSDKIGEEI